MKARITGTFSIEYEVCEAAGVLASKDLALEQVRRDAAMLAEGSLALEDWPPAQVKVRNTYGSLVPIPEGAVIIDGPTGTEIILGDNNERSS